MTINEILGLKSRKRGRPVASSLPTEREKHIRVVIDRFVRGLTLAEICELRKIDRRTVQRWTNRGLGYDDPRIDAIRAAMARVN